jgi:DNA primase
MLSQSFLDDLLTRIDLVEYIGRFVSLNRAGAKHKGLCPFHEEQSPSFVVASTHYHCYGCGAHGNAFDFVMERDGLDFISTVKQFADRAGIAVPGPRERAEKDERADMREVLDWASAEYHRHLYHSPTSQAAWSELDRRDIESDTILRFRLGFAPDAWRTLSDSDKFHPYKLSRVGLAVKPDRGGYYDVFRNRLIFPILDIRGRVIGFGGRRLGDDGAKYINSPETPLYRKSEELFGIHLALPSIRKANEVIVAEGYFDVLTPAQHGIENIVAPCGTALTIEQARRLLVLADNLVICFDGDQAGAKATWRSVEMLLPEVQDRHTVRLVRMPTGHDPDSLVRSDGSNAFRQLIDNSPTMMKFILGE